MRNLGFGRHVLGIGLAVVMLAGCGASEPPVGAPGNTAPFDTRAFSHVSQSSPAHHAAQSGSLLYVVGSAEVYILSYPKGKPVDKFKYSGSADCSDSSGNVFITGFYGISEFAHGGTRPIKTLSTYDDAYACSVDPTTGNLAVLHAGGVLIFKKAKGKGVRMNEPTFVPRHCGYDNKGNLFVDGYLYSTFKFAELPKGSANFKEITINPTITASGGQVQWDGKYITVEGIGYGTVGVYRLRISGSGGTVVSTAQLVQTSMNPQLSWIQDNTIMVPYSIGSGYTDVGVGLWNYPSGGKPIKTITKGFGNAPQALLALTVSVAPR